MRNSQPLLDSSIPVVLNNKRCISTEEIEVWTAKLMWLWEATQLVEVRPREGGMGVLFIMELDSPYQLHVGIGHKGIDVCTLWRNDQCVMWNNLIGFCSMWNSFHSKADYEFESSMRQIIRRNCFLLGAPVEATPEERQMWLQWLAHAVDTRKTQD